MTRATRCATEICRVGASLYARGYVHASAGNISVRTDTGYLITPTDACLGTLDAARLADVNAQRRANRRRPRIEDARPAPRDLRRRPDARCVIHTHATHLVALTLAGVWSADDIVPPITPYFVMKVGHVPLIAYRRPGDPAVGDAVAQRIAAGARARRADPRRDARAPRPGGVAPHAGRGERGARRARRNRAPVAAERPKPAPLSDAQIDELRTHFGAAW